MLCAADRKQNSAAVKTFVDNAPRPLLASKDRLYAKTVFYKQFIITYSKGLPILKIEMIVLRTNKEELTVKTANRSYCWPNPNIQFFVVLIQIFWLDAHLCRSSIYVHSHKLMEKPFKMPCTPIFNTDQRLFQLYWNICQKPLLSFCCKNLCQDSYKNLRDQKTVWYLCFLLPSKKLSPRFVVSCPGAIYTCMK